jgi:hypothetical protein
VLAGEFVCQVRPGGDLHLLRPLGRLGMRVGILVIEERLQAPPRPVLGHQRNRRLVDELAMLDAPHACADRLTACGV